MPPMPEFEEVSVKVRLVGNVTGNVYSEDTIKTKTFYKEPDLYVGYCHLAIPMYPSPGPETPLPPGYDPEDTAIILQAATTSDNTVIGWEGEEAERSGHWLGTIEFRPGATVEIPITTPIS